MKKNTHVSWTTNLGIPGSGITISDEDDGHVLVAVLSEGEVHHVIWCTVTWLTPTESAS